MTYLDHAATTAVRPEAVRVWHDTALQLGNPSSLHGPGRRVRALLEEARETIAAVLDCDPTEVILTSGGTEADNLAIAGTARARRAATGANRVAVSAIEHPAVLESALALRVEGFEVELLPVGRDGRLRECALEALDEHTAVVSVMWANNETGVVQPLEAVVARARELGVPVHTDAVQAVGHVEVSFRRAGVDLLSLSGHKLGAPVGVGALLARRGTPLAPVTHGGGQERGVRSGTLNAAGAAALAAALTAAAAEVERSGQRELRRRLEACLAAIPGVHISGAGLPEAQRLPTHAHAVIDGVDADALLFALDRAGIAASSGSACRAGVQEPSHVIEAMGFSAEQARGGLRCSLGWTSTAADVAALAAVIAEVVTRARAAHAATRR